MTTANQMLQKFRKIDVRAEAILVIKETEPAVLQFNKDQLFIGEGADGKRLPFYRSSTYAAFKHGLNSLPGIGTPDYLLSGRLYSQMMIDWQRKDTFRVISRVPYFADVLARGGDPMGLQEDSRDDYYFLWFRPRLMKRIAARTGVLLG